MKTARIFLALAMVLGLLAGCGKAEPSREQQAMAAYQALLEAAPALEGEHPELLDASFGDAENRQLFGEHYDRFALIDLDQDGVPELITVRIVNFRWNTLSVFTFADGRAVLCGTIEQDSAANGAYDTCICAGSHLHSVWRGSTPVGEAEEDSAFALRSGSLEAAECTAQGGENLDDIAQSNTAGNRTAMAAK